MTDNKNNKNWGDKLQEINNEYGRIQPQATDVEEVVLGAVMLEKGAEMAVLDILKPESFYTEPHQKIFAAIVSLSERHEPIDMMTVTEELRKKNQLEEVGGAYYVSQLTSRVASAAHLEFHARIIAQKFIQRELIRITSDIQNKAFDLGTDVDDLLDFSERELFNLAYGNIKKETAKIDTVISEAINQIEEAAKREDGLSGVPCGYTRLDRVTSGWQPSDLVIVAARPSMGKTAFVLSMARNIAVEHKRPVGFFSLEMSSVQLVNRLIVGETELSSEKIKTGKLQDYEWEQLEYKIKNLAEAPIFIDDTPAISLFELRAKCRRLVMQHKVELIILDYLQLMSSTGDNYGSREQAVSNISRGLKSIAKELDIPIIALSQLNRSVEMRSGDKRPQLSDLRESGAIEQDADIVCFIHRPEKFGILEDEEGMSTKGRAEIIIAKHRNGAVCDVHLKFIDHMAKFVDPEVDTLEPISLGEEVETTTFSSKMNEEQDDVAEGDVFDTNTNFEDEERPF